MMNLLNSLLSLIGLGGKPSIAKITKPMQKIVTDLERFAVVKSENSAVNADKAAELLTRSKEEAEAAVDARKLASRYSSLTL